MRAAMCQQLGATRLTLEYWAGQHRQASHGSELGFILGNGIHWWCIRSCGPHLQEWEEVDSLGNSHVASWPSSDELLGVLADRDETVLVLYPAPQQDEEEEDDEEDDGVPKLKRASRKAEQKAARKREKEQKKEKRDKEKKEKEEKTD